MNPKRDYYKILNIRKNADEKSIKKAYKKLALKYHPDVNKSKDAERKFKIISEAYHVLSDKEKRREYDIQRREYIKENKNELIIKHKNKIAKRRRAKKTERKSSLSKYVNLASTLEEDYGLISGIIGLKTPSRYNRSSNLMSTLLNSKSGRKGKHRHRHGRNSF